ncbi:hypothetical protein ANN_27187 [Periplaneta americana]|uniref:Uncharacterized protein n=1 Tax=Periplaneta americana TaxID=6978 RepID=A0ABQ8RXB8_PERAM|nr:hypothetical protein ANN_27187 [Periplaneta americana]
MAERQQLRQPVIALVHVGYSASMAARDIGVPLSTAKRWAKFFIENGEVVNRLIPGRPHISTREEDAMLLREAENHPFGTASQLKMASNFPCSPHTPSGCVNVACWEWISYDGAELLERIHSRFTAEVYEHILANEMIPSAEERYPEGTVFFQQDNHRYTPPTGFKDGLRGGLMSTWSGLSANDDSGYNYSANDRSAFYRYKTASIDYSRICNRKRISEKSRRLEIQYCRRSNKILSQGLRKFRTINNLKEGPCSIRNYWDLIRRFEETGSVAEVPQTRNQTSHRCLIDLRTRSQTPGVLRMSSEHATIRFRRDSKSGTETNKPMILNGPTSRNREGSDQVSVEAKQLGHLYLSIDQETFDPSTSEPYE